VAESGPARRRMAGAAEVASGAGGAPGHHESTGTRQSGQPRQGTRLVRPALTHAAPAAAVLKRPLGPRHPAAWPPAEARRTR
jgi:transposase